MKLVNVGRELIQQLRAGRQLHPGIRILAYHGVVERITDRRVERNFHLLEHFRDHVAFLRRCHVMSLEELVHTPKRPRVTPSVVVTFDDGFRNNLLAADILCTHNIPFTVFLSTNNVAKGQPIWPTLLRLVLARGSARCLRLAGVEYDLDRDTSAFFRIRNMFKSLDAVARVQRWNELVKQLASGELEELVDGFPTIAMLSWNHVRTLGRWGVTFGSHGFQHELHHASQPIHIRRHELEASKRQLEAALETDCIAFAFPNGSHNPHSAFELTQSGYQLGFTTISRAATSEDERLLLPRVMPGPSSEKIATAVLFGN